jgi:hypothetical protein
MVIYADLKFQFLNIIPIIMLFFKKILNKELHLLFHFYFFITTFAFKLNFFNDKKLNNLLFYIIL